MNRIRSMGSLTDPRTFTETWSKTGAVVFTGVGTRTGTAVVMADRTIPQFHKKSGSGEVFFNPMQKVRTEVNDNTSGMQIQNVNPGSSAYSTTYTDSPGIASWVLLNRTTPLTGAVPVSRSDSTLLPVRLDVLPEARCIGEATTKAQGLPSSASMLVTMAEFHQTMSLVPDLLGSWTRFFRRINNQRLRVPVVRQFPTDVQKYLGGQKPLTFLRDQYRELVTLWLASRFGLRPLIMETQGVLQALQKQVGTTHRMTSRGISAASRSDYSVGVLRSGVADWQFSVSTHNEIRVRAMQLFQGQLSLAEDIGLSLSSVPEAAIDLIRFSFVLNWAVNVNDFFRALGRFINPSVPSLGGCYVKEVLLTTTIQPLQLVSNDPNYIVTKQCNGLVTSTLSTTTRVPGVTPPKLVLRASPMQWARDARLLDAIALLDVQLRGRNVRNLAGLSKLSGNADIFKTPF